jgi:hypothetical protein
MTSPTAVIAFVRPHCTKPNVQRERFEAANADAVRVLLTGTKIFCINPDCKEQMYDVNIYLREILASTPVEVPFLPLEPSSGSA